MQRNVLTSLRAQHCHWHRLRYLLRRCAANTVAYRIVSNRIPLPAVPIAIAKTTHYICIASDNRTSPCTHSRSHTYGRSVLATTCLPITGLCSGSDSASVNPSCWHNPCVRPLLPTLSSCCSTEDLRYTPGMSTKRAHARGRGRGRPRARRLKNFAVGVLAAVERAGVTTYESVAAELISETVSSSDTRCQIEIEEEQKNVRRRVYDALNVLASMGFVDRALKDVVYRGIAGFRLRNGLSKLHAAAAPPSPSPYYRHVAAARAARAAEHMPSSLHASDLTQRTAMCKMHGTPAENVTETPKMHFNASRDILATQGMSRPGSRGVTATANLNRKEVEELRVRVRERRETHRKLKEAHACVQALVSRNLIRDTKRVTMRSDDTYCTTTTNGLHYVTADTDRVQLPFALIAARNNTKLHIDMEEDAEEIGFSLRGEYNVFYDFDFAQTVCGFYGLCNMHAAQRREEIERRKNQQQRRKQEQQMRQQHFSLSKVTPEVSQDTLGDAAVENKCNSTAVYNTQYKRAWNEKHGLHAFPNEGTSPMTTMTTMYTAAENVRHAYENAHCQTPIMDTSKYVPSPGVAPVHNAHDVRRQLFFPRLDA